MGNREGRSFTHRYELLREIGFGGCARIHEAHDRVLDRLVAIKIATVGAVEASSGARLLREARASAALHHPNVCFVSDIGMLPSGEPYFVMERLFGETLRSANKRGRFTALAAVDIATQMLSALEAAHGRGIVHRDVKPDNVFLVSRVGMSPVVKLLDFGLCCQAESVNDMTLTAAGTVVGTPGYMSPEQVSGVRAFDPRMDVFSTGIVLHEMLTGRRVFHALDDRTAMFAVLARDVPPPSTTFPDIPWELEEILMRALERDPDARWQSARAMKDALLSVAHEESVQRHVPLSRTRVPAWEQPTRQMRIAG